jgi:hypothetical protein
MMVYLVGHERYRRPVPHAIARLVLLVSTSLLCACPGPGDKGPTTVCTKADEKCVLSSGVLGICNVVDCADGQPAPCLICRSQH